MNFIRKKKRGQNQKVRRTWFSEEDYRITWRKEVYGVRVPARFQSCVRVLISYSDGTLRECWDFVNLNRRLIKTLRTAIEECERHKCLWERVCEATSVRALKELFGGKLPLGLPVWARKRLDRRLYAILIDNRPTKYRDNEEDESCTVSLQQSSDAPGPGGPIKTSASPAEAAAKRRKKPAVKRIGKRSKRTNQKNESTTGSGARQSRGSRKTKSVPDGS